MSKETSLLAAFKKEKKRTDKAKTAIDIYSVFSIIEKLFREQGLLNENESDTSKITFYYSYPTKDKQDDQESRVMFDLESRKLTQRKGQATPQTSNLITGTVEEIVRYSFENKVSLAVESKSAEKLLQILQTLEGIFIKEREWFSENYDVKVIYDGFTTNTVPTNNVNSKTYTKKMFLTFYTESQLLLEYETLKYINKN